MDNAEMNMCDQIDKLTDALVAERDQLRLQLAEALRAYRQTLEGEGRAIDVLRLVLKVPTGASVDLVLSAARQLLERYDAERR